MQYSPGQFSCQESSTNPILSPETLVNPKWLGTEKKSQELCAGRRQAVNSHCATFGCISTVVLSGRHPGYPHALTQSLFILRGML